MFVAALLRWWYVDGWKQRAHIAMDRLSARMDFFSIGLLLKTMFSLFREDGARRVEGSLSVKIHAFFGRLLSRILGAMIRSCVLLVGVVVIAFQVVLSTLILLAWGLVPLFPIIGVIVTLTGWTPWR